MPQRAWPFQHPGSSCLFVGIGADGVGSASAGYGMVEAIDPADVGDGKSIVGDDPPYGPKCPSDGVGRHSAMALAGV